MTSLFVFSPRALCTGTPLCARPLLALPHGFEQASGLISIRIPKLEVLLGALFPSDALPDLALCHL